MVNRNYQSYFTMPNVCERIRTEMRARRMKVTELTAKLDGDYAHIYRVVNGFSPLYLSDAVKIADALGVSIDELVRGKEVEA